MKAVYKIADIAFRIEPRSRLFKDMLAPYIADTACYDAALSPCDPENEVTQTLRQLSLQLLYHFDGIFLHGAALIYRGKAYLFTAPPGTGKSTHALLWKEVLADRVQILNGDKPLLRLTDDRVTVYGSPWRGKEQLGINSSAPLGGIYILRRGAENAVTHIDPVSALAELIGATVYPPDEAGADKLLTFMEKLTSRASIRVLHCRPDTGAVNAVLSDLEERL